MSGANDAPAGDLWRFLHGLPNVVLWQIEEENYLSYVSHGVTSLLGVGPETVLQQPDLWTGRVYNRHKRRYQQAIAHVRERGASMDIEYRTTLPDARVVWLRDHLTFDAVTGKLFGITTRIDDERDNEKRLAFRNKAGNILASSLDTRELLQKLGELIAGSLGDICVIEVEEDDETVVVARAANNRRLARELEEAGPMLLARKQLPARLREGRAAFYTKLTRKQLVGLAGATHTALLWQAEPHALILAPLTVRGRTFGTVAFFCADPGKTYESQDVELATEVCRQAATALDHARLFEQAGTAREVLLRENEMKDEFLGILSHELRTPMTVIYGATRVLPRVLPPLDDDCKALIDDLYSASERTVRLIEDLMLLARLNLGEQPEMEEAAAGAILREVSQEFGQEYPARPLTAQDDTSARVLASPAYLRQILFNLLSNADKYSPAGARIHAGVTEKAREVVFFVEDRGQGLPESELERIFERFYRSANSEAVSGAGMGLAICKRLIAAQDGRIWAENGATGGLKVSVALKKP